MTSQDYQQILDQNLLPSVRELKLGQKWIMYQDNNLKYSSKIIKEWLQRKKIHTLDWPSQSPDLFSNWDLDVHYIRASTLKKNKKQ